MTAKSHNDTPAENRPQVIALFPGSFNPFTVGHMSVLRRALPLFDHIYVVVGVNESKGSSATCHADSRVTAIETTVSGMDRVSVIAWSGLMVDLARQLGATFLVRGVRTASDFEAEQNLATINRSISGIETILIPTLPEHVAVSSSVVRELQHFGHDASQFLP
ncbi:MAG: pantetheine-phosphate adenylyltransferase [Clostridiales bacterium]|nr:pantetheine-phosphate adenylyltransferase [Clostridiales bacterium]